MLSRKRLLRHISALAADGTKDAKRARQSQNRRASSVPDNYDQDDSIKNIELRPRSELASSNAPNVEPRPVDFSSKFDELEMEKSDIDDEQSGSETEDEQFD